jgi:prepilin-type N-terminal cleavage/methylation domain-containing protein
MSIRFLLERMFGSRKERRWNILGCTVENVKTVYPQGARTAQATFHSTCHKAGFTLIELLVAIAILAALAKRIPAPTLRQ